MEDWITLYEDEKRAAPGKIHLWIHLQLIYLQIHLQIQIHIQMIYLFSSTTWFNGNCFIGSSRRRPTAFPSLRDYMRDIHLCISEMRQAGQDVSGYPTISEDLRMLIPGSTDTAPQLSTSVGTMLDIFE